MSKKLLLADDSVVIQKLVGLSFANEDIEIFSTDNGDDAVIQAREIQPDVVLADVVMPGLSGYEVCEAIKQDPALAHTPVLLLTGTFEAFDEARASSAGANGQITKPFEAQALVERVNEVMNAPPQAAPVAAPPAAAAQVADIGPARSDHSIHEETIVASLPPVSSSITDASDDFFDSGVSSLSDFGESPSLEEDDFSMDVTPNLSTSSPAFPATGEANEATASGLFGAPGEGGIDELDTQGGNMAIGQAVAPKTDHSIGADDAEEDDATMALMPDAPPALGLGLGEAAAETSPDEELGDPLADLDEDFGLIDPLSDPLLDAPALPAARPLDLDSVLDAAPSEGEPTILMTVDDVNASTSPNLSTPAAMPSAPPIETQDSLDDLTVHAPSADIDSDAAAAPSPEAFDIDPSPAQASAVADLDASLEATIDGPRPVIAESSMDRTPLFDSADELPTPSRKGPDRSDPLGFRPTNVGADELDFAFDVSEQVAAENAHDRSETTPSGAAAANGNNSGHSLGHADEPSREAPTDYANEESFSSLMDISESQILGSTREASEPAAETIVAGYDVSSSDLATAESSFSESVSPTESASPPAAPIPEPEELHDLPVLPEAHTPISPSAPVTGLAGLFDGLSTGSPMEEIATQSDFSAASDLDVDEDLLEDDFDADAQEASSSSLDAAESLFSDAPVASTELPLPIQDEDDLAISSGGIESNAPHLAALDISDVPDIAGDEHDDHADQVAHEYQADRGAEADQGDRRVPHLSPLMEQQIQETLEKVAWEAFSDLSESIVKQVMTRVEKIAWEVIPEMAETLVREEIRKMKGEED